MKIKKLLLPLLVVLSCSSCSLDLASLIPSGCSINHTADKVGDTPTDKNVTLQKYWDNCGYDILNSIGDQKMLVIPIEFKGANLQFKLGGMTKTAETTTLNKTDIYNAFFGATSDTGWESVASYYHKSSYGKFSLTGTVADPVEIDMNITDFVKYKGEHDEYDDPTWYALRKGVEGVKNKGDINLRDFDKDANGYIDSIFLVYNVNYHAIGDYDSRDVLWAYTYWDYDNSASLSSPVGSVYGWASAAFLYEGHYGKPDAHTFIHETGHILGLDDYYSYDYDDYGAIGGIDMMDLNIGDHNAYSKSALGWCTPKHITEEGEYTINSFESSGDCLVIRPEWKGSMLDEYLIIEYYTPTGLNYFDSIDLYSKNGAKMFSNSGIKVLHVDTRLIEIKQDANGKQSSQGFVTSLKNSYNNLSKTLVYSDFANSNTKSRSVYGEKIVSIIDGNADKRASNRLKLGISGYANDSFLFHASSNKTFGTPNGRYSKFTFNCGVQIDFSFEIVSANSTSATLKFTKL